MRTALHVALALASLAPGAGYAQDSVSKTELRRQPPAITSRQLRDQLWAIFVPPDERRRATPKRPLSDVFLDTRPYATRYPGLCRMDAVRVSFAPVDRDAPRDADTRVRAYGLTVSARYHALKLPLPKVDEDAEPPSPVGGACARVGNDARYFDAASDDDAREGIEIAWRAIAAVRTGQVPVAPCVSTPADKLSCTALVAALDPAAASAVERCEAPTDERCCKVTIDDREITARVVHADTYPRPATLPADNTVLSVAMTTLIVLGDTIAD